MNKRILSFVLAVATMAALAGCASGDRVVLLADPDGHVGSVNVTSTAGSQTLTQAKTGVEVARADRAPTAPEAVTDQTIQDVWGPALAAMPPRPRTILLYFEAGTADLTEESRTKQLPEISAILANWAYPHLLVAGHADATGSDTVNIQISRRRAEAVRDILVGMNVSGAAIEVTSHGKRNPLIKTPDGVAEPRNRRVSVSIQ